MNNDNNSRREFVKTSSLLAGGLIMSPLLSKANFFSGAEGVIKIALVGCGGRGTGAATQALLSKQNVKLVAMADAFRDKLDTCYKRLMSDDGSGSSVKSKVDVPEENKFVGFDGYAKAIALAEVIKSLGLTSADCAVMGDDWPDMQMMKQAGLRICPAQGHEAVKEFAHLVTTRNGGNSAVREVCDLILKAQNRYEELLAKARS